MDLLYDETLPKMTDYLDGFTEEELDHVADTVVSMVAFAYKYVKNEKGKPLRVEWHQLLWLAHLELHAWVLILGPRGHGKSTTFTTWMLYKLCHESNYKFLIASHIEELADEFSMRVQSYLEEIDPEPLPHEPYLVRDFDIQKGKQWKVGKAYFRGKSYPWVKTVAVKAGMTGGRFDGAVFDDPFTKLSIDSEKMRRRFKSWANTAVLPSLNETPLQKYVVIGTKKHADDWYKDLMDNPEFACHIDQLYSIVDGEKVYLWPAVDGKDHGFNEERERRKRSQMTPAQFAMEFMNKTVAEDGILFPLKWIEPHFYDDWQAEVPERFREIYMGIDPAMGSERESSSHFGLAVICYDNRPNKQDIYVVELIRERLSMAEQEKIIIQKFRQWNPIHVNMEGDLVNRDFTRRMKSQLPRIRRVFYTYMGKTTGLSGTSEISKKKRINQVIGMLFMAGKIRFRDPKFDRNTRDFLNYEYLQFPEGNLDLMDALNMAVDLVDFRKTVDGSPLVWIQ